MFGVPVQDFESWFILLRFCGIPHRKAIDTGLDFCYTKEQSVKTRVNK